MGYGPTLDEVHAFLAERRKDIDRRSLEEAHCPSPSLADGTPLAAGYFLARLARLPRCAQSGRVIRPHSRASSNAAGDSRSRKSLRSVVGSPENGVLCL